MQHQLIHIENSPRLLLVFAGWGMDYNVFASLRRPGYDVMVVWDYRSFHIDWQIVASYSEICIMAWSMGVFAASQTTQAIDHKVTRRIAVNGTLHPIDERMGIPPGTYNATHDGLTAQSLRKFYRRMCADRAATELFEAHAPSRPVEELKDELMSIADRLVLAPPTSMRWDLAVIGTADRIFPPRNQVAAWQREGVSIEMTDSGHYLDFQALADRHLIDKTMVGTRFGAGTPTYESQASVQIDAAERLVDMMKTNGVRRAISDSHGTVLEIGSGSGMLSRPLAAMIGSGRLEMWDLAAPMPAHLPAGRKYTFRNCDAEVELANVAPESIEHIASASTIQWFNSPERFLRHCHRALRPGGYLCLTTYTRGNMHQISELTGNSLPLLTPQRWIELANGLFETVNWQAYERDLDFETPMDVLRHLKLTGVNALGRSSRGEVSARDIMSRYPMMLDGRYHLSYNPFIFILRKP